MTDLQLSDPRWSSELFRSSFTGFGQNNHSGNLGGANCSAMSCYVDGSLIGK